MKKNLTAIAITLAGFGVQDAFAAVTASAGTVVTIGCSAPSSTGATVYSIDQGTLDLTGASNTTILPTLVATGVNCAFALNQMNTATFTSVATSTIPSSAAARWVSAGTTVVPTVGNTTNTVTTGNTAINVTVPNSGYSLQAYTFVAQ